MIKLMKKLGVALLLGITFFSLASPMFVVILLLKSFAMNYLNISIDILLLSLMGFYLYIAKKDFKEIIDIFKCTKT